jgi:SAM-dependent methyltransferase
MRAGLRFCGRAARVLKFEIALWCSHALSCLRARRYRGQRDLKLHLACGPKYKAGWVNVDFSARADLQLDLRRRLPFADGSCELVYAEHFLEHLDYPNEALDFLRECRRVLRNGGRIRIGVPDAAAPMPWVAADIAAGRDQAPPLPGIPEWATTPMEQYNFLFRQNYIHWWPEHKFAYDFATLKKCFALAGLPNIVRKDFDAELDSEDRKVGTLYVEALK